jgi:hypothetical protein
MKICSVYAENAFEPKLLDHIHVEISQFLLFFED